MCLDPITRTRDIQRRTTCAYVAEAQICLLHAMRALGIPVPHVGAGPFWALRDGNVFLQPFDKHLEPHLGKQLGAGKP